MSDRPKRVALASLGCKVNRADLRATGVLLLNAGVEVVDGVNGEADLYVVNSCTVTHAAGSQSLKLGRQLSRNHPDHQVLISGCHARLKELEGEIGSDDLRLVPARDPTELAAVICAELGREFPPSDDHPPGSFPISSRDEAGGSWRRVVEERARPTVKVQDGCDQGCSYCVLPRVRGPSRSRPTAEVTHEVRRLVADGFAEIVLSGIRLGRYGAGWDPAGQPSLLGLIVHLLAETEVEQLRLSSLEPNEITPALIELLGDEPRLCRHLHLPLQSGSDRILAAMRRPYSAGQARLAITRVLDAVPGMAVGADVIAGFPGETDTDFEQTYRLVTELDIAYLHVFPFSPRPGTAATDMQPRVPERIARKRCAALRELSEKKRQAFYASQVGRRVGLVVERRLDDVTVGGTSDNYLELAVKSDAAPRALLKVEVIDGGRPARAEVRS